MTMKGARNHMKTLMSRKLKLELYSLIRKRSDLLQKQQQSLIKYLIKLLVNPE
jgi:hypothetical protein